MIRSFTLLFIGIIFSIVLYKSYQYDNLFRVFIFSILGVIWLTVFIYTTLKDRKLFNVNKKIISYLPSFFGILSFLVVFGIYYYYENKINSPSLIKAQNHGVYADFKKNGKYIIKSGSWATKIHQYGTYKLDENIIIIDNLKLDDVLVSNRFKICSIQNSDLTNPTEAENFRSGKYLIEIDQKGNEIKNRLLDFDKEHRKIFGSFKFEITEDNRK